MHAAVAVTTASGFGRIMKSLRRAGPAPALQEAPKPRPIKCWANVAPTEASASLVPDDNEAIGILYSITTQSA